MTRGGPPPDARAAEGTAACRVDLAGGAPGAVSVTVAIDRRAWCRVETGVDGVRIESKDTLRKVGGEDVSEALGRGPRDRGPRAAGDGRARPASAS